VIACAGFGAGLSWGAAILKWGQKDSCACLCGVVDGTHKH
jgi:hypothetical protein